MTWTLLTTIDVIAAQWVFSAPVEGRFFRLTQSFSGLPDFYFKGKLAQFQLNANGTKEVFDYRTLEAKPEIEVLELKSPPNFSDRRIGIQGPRGEIPSQPWNWSIKIEVSDFLEGEGGGSSGTSITSRNAQVDSNCSRGMALYAKAGGTLDLAQANALSTSRVVGLAAGNGIALTAANYELDGVIEQSDWSAVIGSASLVAGNLYYLDPITQGRLTTIAPTSSLKLVVQVGVALTATALSIEVEPPILL